MGWEVEGVSKVPPPYVHRPRSQGFPPQSAQTFARGMVCLILELTQGQRAGGEEEVGVLGPCWDCERPTLSLAWRGQGGGLIFPLCPQSTGETESHLVGTWASGLLNLSVSWPHLLR